jgi:hypothetical protein
MMEKRWLLQQMFLGKLDICMQKTETRSMYPTQISIQGRSKTLMEVGNVETSAGKSRKYTGIFRNSQ